MTKIITLHACNDNQLNQVIDEMRTLGAPVIRAVWVECHDAWVALEGTHRLHAAQRLGLTPIIDEVEYSDDVTTADLGLDWYEPMTIAEVCDEAWRRDVLEF